MFISKTGNGTLLSIEPARQPIKLNLYRDYEVRALALAIADSPFLQMAVGIDCVMVSDSYLMTHLGRSSTRVSEGEKPLLLDMMVNLVREVASEVRRSFDTHPPFIIADMPDGSTRDKTIALASANRMIDAGADVVKIEVHNEAIFDIVSALSAQNIRVMTHLGYTPQGGQSGRVGTTLAEAFTLFKEARNARDAGADSLVIEKVDEFVHRALVDRPESLPSYAIFSGKSANGGQSLNVWDSVFRPGFEARYFPPTASYDVASYPDIYQVPVIADHLGRLLKLTAMGEFPLSPPSRFKAEERRTLQQYNPWLDQEVF